MRIYSAHAVSVPFPKEGFKKWDVITPKNSEEYGIKYVIVDYQRWEYSTGKIEFYYHLESYIGDKYERNLDNHEKLYSKRKEISLKLKKELEYDIKQFFRDKNNIIESLDNIDVSLLEESILKIELFCKKLESIK